MTSPSTAPPEHDEEKLVLLALEGDAEAFGILYTSYLDAIYRYIYFRIGDAVEAEDLTEEVFVKAWEALPSYRQRQWPFTSWLYRIAHNLTVDYHRRPMAAPLSELEALGLPAGPESTEATVERQQGRAALAAAIRQLDDEEQVVVVLRFVEGLSHQEVAVTIGKSIEASRVIQHRALEKLSRMMKS